MLTMVLRSSICIFTVFLRFVASERTPTLTEISSLRDPVLDDVFRSTGSSASASTSPEAFPYPDETSQGGGSQFRPDNRQPDMSGPSRFSGQRYEVPINHAHALGPRPEQGPPPPPQQNSGLTQLAETGANVFATGAHAFYRGAASVGQAFGLPQGGYEVPLLSSASQFFGR
ncbi:unnamed protein product [Caenorhabditis auriculariae]|uniref:Uncharacterized protein n=1 Tax=Caenorhabditis auriculariae TaxID=2777116 RepID=A0A8S1H190_9PELO|nr:unnamed protein product [Caenorhabditis auriculariae]